MYSQTVEKLIKLFSKFPTVGPRTAARFVFYLIKSSQEDIEEFLETVKELKSKIKICSRCYRSFESNDPGKTVALSHDREKVLQNENGFCPVCQDPRRDKTLICIVEKEIDLEVIEKTNQFKGLYFILGDIISGWRKEESKKKMEERLSKLIERIKKGELKEVIFALNPTSEGQNTALWLKRKLEPTEIKTTQLGRGLPVGGELEYADEETLSSAFENRK